MLPAPPQANKKGRRESVNQTGRAGEGSGLIQPSNTNVSPAQPAVDKPGPSLVSPGNGTMQDPFDMLGMATVPKPQAQQPISSFDPLTTPPHGKSPFDAQPAAVPVQKSPAPFDPFDSLRSEQKVSTQGAAAPGSAPKAQTVLIDDPFSMLDFSGSRSSTSATPPNSRKPSTNEGQVKTGTGQDAIKKQDTIAEASDDEGEEGPGQQTPSKPSGAAANALSPRTLDKHRRDSAAKGQSFTPSSGVSPALATVTPSKDKEGGGGENKDKEGGASHHHKTPSTGGTAPTIDVDVLSYMKKGTPFLKYGTYGYPHFRNFQIAEGNTKLVWYSQSKKLKDTQIDIRDIDEIKLGQHTPNFQKHRAPELARSSFSVVYNKGQKTLDLIAKDPNEFRIWTAGLRKLIDISKDPKQELSELKQVVVTLPVVRGRRSSVDIVDVKTGKSADLVLPEEPQKQNQGGAAAGNKSQYKEVAEAYGELKVKLHKAKETLKDPKYFRSKQWDSIQTIVKRVDLSIEKCQQWFQNGEYASCDDEIWRAGVDVEALVNMMKALKADS